jgi:geranylgeranyl diphosphate synthase type I
MNINGEKKNKLYDTFIDEMTKISLGQATDIAWHKGMDDVNEEKYLQMCAFKTGTLARMAAKFSAVVVGLGDDEIEKVGACAESIGVAFQIQDDILNITGSKDWGKEYADDITEGKRSMMVVRTLDIANKKDKKRLVEILGKHTRNKKLLDEAIEILKKYDSINYSKEFARKLVSDAWKGVRDVIPENAAKNKIEDFVKFMVEREV